MDEKIQLRGWLAASRNLKITCLGEYMDLGVCVQYRNLLNKFPADQIFFSDTEQVCFLDGYVYHREDFIRPEGYHEWTDSFAFSLREDRKKHLSKLRGAFCGYHYEKETDRITVYTDQVSNKAVYYYCEKDGWILSDHLEYMVRVLRENGIAYDFDERAAQYMLTCGYMLDDSTFVTQIRRLLPGYYAEIAGGSVSLYRYYELPCGREEMSEDEAVERIDSAFRQAVDREFAKDREYGYRHLVDLSGGLDSRMVTWIAHDLGYTEQLNVAYGRLGYLDQKISEQVAAALKHEYLHKPLDDLTWMYDVDEMTLKNNGAAICLGMTGGNRLLQALNTERFGIEHTGMVGDAILSTFYHDRALNDRAPAFGSHQYSNRLQYDFDETILSDYRNQESFALMTRGILGAQSSYLIRHHYVETGSAFLDVDFLEAVMTIPFEYRKGHHIYLKWIAKKYPQAAEFVWEKWGVKPKESQIFKRKVRTTGKLAEGCLRKVTHQPERVSMNPTDYWYKNDANVRKYFEAMFGQRIGSRLLSDRLRDDVKQLFIEGNFSEKTQALTVLSGLHLFFGEG